MARQFLPLTRAQALALRARLNAGDRALSDAERAAVRRYLGGKHNITVA